MRDSNKIITIKEWNVLDRPREKLMSKGKEVLTDAELIAILIGSGSKKETAVELSKRILLSCENKLVGLSNLSIEQLTKFLGIGEAKAISIITALELGKRCRFESVIQKKKIGTSKDVFELMHPVIGELKHEEFWIVYLSNSNRVLYKMQLSKGGLTGTVVDVRLLFKKALELLAVGIVLCHNHPSGSLVPSTADKQVTEKIKQAGTSLDIKVLDHLIITEKTYFSFADNEIL